MYSMSMLKRSSVVVICVMGALLAMGSCAGLGSGPESSGPALSAVEPVDLTGLENVILVNEGLISGGVPQGDAGFDSLRSLGVRTIVSVDALAPDADRARVRGMRTVHLPVGYDEIGDGRAFELASAMRDLPRPIYIHCHHGKHRGPAAAGMAMVGTGELTHTQASELLTRAGTSPDYPGLYECVAYAPVFDESTFGARTVMFVERAEVEGFAAIMAEIDRVMSHMSAVSRAGWAVPPEHPDLVPSAEAGRLTDLLRSSAADPEAMGRDEAFRELLDACIARAADMERKMAAGAEGRDLSRSLGLVARSCRDCHVRYRDK